MWQNGGYSDDCQSDHKIPESENPKINSRIRSTHQAEADLDENARQVRTFLLRAEEDKRRLAQRIDQLITNERVLIMELERLKRRGGGPTAGTTNNGRSSQKKATGNLEEHITGLIQDRDYWKGQVELLSQMLACPSIVGLRNAKPLVTGGKIGSAPKLARSKSQRESQHKIKEDNKMLPESRGEVRHTKCRLSTGSPPFTRSQSLPREHSCEESLENHKLRLERDELRMMLNRFEKRIQEIQSNVQTLTKERDDLNRLYSDAKNEIHRLHHDLYDVQNASNRRAAIQETHLQSDLDRARWEIEQLTAEKESLAAKYKKASEMESVDKLRHNKQMDYMEKALSEATNERDEVIARVGQLKRRLEELQTSQMQIEQRLNERNEKLKKCVEESNNLRHELETRQRVLEETEAKLAAARNRSIELESVCQQTEASSEETSRRLLLEKDTNSRLQAELQDANLERSKMHQEIEELMRAKSQLQKNNKYLEKKCMSTITERDEVNSNCNRLAADINSLQQKLKIAEMDIATWSNKYNLERSAKESFADRCMLAEKRLEECEFRGHNLSNELREHQDARYQLERQVKTLADSTERLKTNVERLASENETLKTNIDLANKDKVKLEACIEDLTAANRQLIRDRDDCTHRHSLARERIVELESDLRTMEAEVKRQTGIANKEHQTVVDLRQENDSIKQRCEELNTELAGMVNRHRSAEERFHQAEIRATQLERELRMEHDDYLQIRSRLEATEEQRDAGEVNISA
ncbi:unnamed protein product [Rodentolepis nana]|uniref:Cytospin-A n=1 Tax=Rodentolepis nana TaxID=102285 RepID=A0A158QH43_RODNA|nr:unnamed protein product [Rodentolepis nana]